MSVAGRARTLLVAAAALVGGILLTLMLLFGLPQTLRGTSISDDAGARRGPDFLTHYTAGRMLLVGDAAHLYDAPLQSAAQEAALGAPLDRPSPFLLPPAAALLFAPFALLPLAPAATLWAALTVVLMLTSLRLVWPLSPLCGQLPGALAALALLGTYPVGMNLVGGNNAALWLTVYALGARLYLTGRIVAAGAVLGLGALKPQLFLAVPILLLAQRRWRALTAFAAVAAALAALSLALVGRDGARDYVAYLTSDAYRAEVAVAEAWRMLSLPALARALAPHAPDLIPVAIALAGMLLLGWAVRTRAAAPPRPPGSSGSSGSSPRPEPSLDPAQAAAYAAMVLVGVAIDPHVFLYDALVLAVPILLLAGGPGWGAPAWALAALWALTWAMPFRDAPAPGSPAAIPWVALPLLALAAAALHDARTRPPTPESSGSSASFANHAKIRGAKSPSPCAQGRGPSGWRLG